MNNIKTVILKNGLNIISYVEEAKYGKYVFQCPFEIVVAPSQDGTMKMFLKALNPYSKDDIFFIEKDDVLTESEPLVNMVQLYLSNAYLYKTKFKKNLTQLVSSSIENLEELEDENQENQILN